MNTFYFLDVIFLPWSWWLLWVALSKMVVWSIVLVLFKTWYAFEGWKLMVDESWSCQAGGQNKSNLHMFGKCLNYTPAKWRTTKIYKIMLSGYFEEEKQQFHPHQTAFLGGTGWRLKKMKALLTTALVFVGPSELKRTYLGWAPKPVASRVLWLRLWMLMGCKWSYLIAGYDSVSGTPLLGYSYRDLTPST